MKTSMGIRSVALIDDGRPAVVRIECPVCKSVVALSLAQFTIDVDGNVFPDVVCMKVVAKVDAMKRGEAKNISYCNFAGPVRVKGLK